jgi:single-stranded DNA-binding protein
VSVDRVSSETGPDLASMVNHVVLMGVLVDPVVLRVMPSGMMVGRLVIQHESMYLDLPPLEEWRVRADVVVMGELAGQCRTLVPGTLLCVGGRLNQKRWLRDGEVRWGKMEIMACRVDVAAGVPEPESC